MTNATAAPRQAVIFIRANRQMLDGKQAFQQNITWQRAYCQQHAQALGVTIIREYVETGGAVALDRRHVLMDLLDELAALRDARYVITKDRARLAHDTTMLKHIEFAVEQAGAHLVLGDLPMTRRRRRPSHEGSGAGSSLDAHHPAAGASRTPPTKGPLAQRGRRTA